MHYVQLMLIAVFCFGLEVCGAISACAEEFGSLRRGTADGRLDVERVPNAIDSYSSVDARRQWLIQEVMKVGDPIRRYQLVKQVERMSAAQVNQLVEAHQRQSDMQSESELDKARRQLREAQAYRDYLLRLRQQQLAGQAATGYRPVITTLPAGISMGASAVVSPDRRYVRIGVTAINSSIGPVRTFNLKTGETRVISP